jgi:hypothetical protein
VGLVEISWHPLGPMTPQVVPSGPLGVRLIFRPVLFAGLQFSVVLFPVDAGTIPDNCATSMESVT